jgi:predicted PurR-regulated permease PerM
MGAPSPPRALPGGVVLLLALASAVVAVVGLHAAAALAGPVLLALILTVTVSPLTGWLRRHGSPAWLAVTIAVVAIYAALGAVAAAVIISADRLVDLLPSYRDELTNTLGQKHGSELARWLATAAGEVWDGLLQTLLLLTLVIFMAVDSVNLPDRLAAVTRRRPMAIRALHDFARGTRRYVVVTSVFGLAVATVDTIALWVLGIPLPVLWGLLSFTTNYIPNIGFFIGLVPPALLGLIEGGPTTMIAVVVTYCVVNFLIQSVIQPKVVGDAVGLSTTVSFLSVVFWAAVLGPLGALLAVPLTLLAKALLVDADPDTRSNGPAHHRRMRPRPRRARHP